MSADPFAPVPPFDAATTPTAPPVRPFSPFVRLLIGAAATALLSEWARFQADLAWAALPLGAGAVMTVASVARGVVARRRWRRDLAAWQAAEAARAEAAAEAFAAAPSAGDPSGAVPIVGARRRDPATARPAVGAKPQVPGPHDAGRHQDDPAEERDAEDAVVSPPRHEGGPV